ncbi:MAG: phosphomannomutase/phosphoglucomutase [Candidatus Colwellbacteria bacterium]|nr:phosphomannomutase/phosphoglucomutase [Candidatus Colwellbacteria bacterium]
MPMLNPSVFKAYDIRGIVPDELDADGAYKIGRAYAQFLKASSQKQIANSHLRVVVQADARPTSPALKEKIIQGLLEENIRIIDGGLATSPLIHFAINDAQADGGVMVTASHVPPPYNGFKLFTKGAVNIGAGAGMEEIRDLALKTDIPSNLRSQVKGDKKITTSNFGDSYINFILERIKNVKIKPFKVVIDAGNGMAGLLLPKLLKHLPIEAVPLYWEVDMTFPNHEANPLKEETLAALQDKVKEVGADFGVAFDGDADRIGFVNEMGQVVRGDFVGAYLAEEWFLKKEPRAKIIYDIRSSRAVPEAIESAGGQPILSRAGHTFIKQVMRRENALFSEERSGHFYFRDFFYSESALLAFLYLLATLSQTDEKMSAIINRYNKYFTTPELNFTVQDRSPERLQEIAKNFSDAKDISWLDGIFVTYDDWWFNLRYSNTEPLIRLFVEGKNQKIVEEKLELLKHLLAN